MTGCERGGLTVLLEHPVDDAGADAVSESARRAEADAMKTWKVRSDVGNVRNNRPDLVEAVSRRHPTSKSLCMGIKRETTDSFTGMV
jgi:hypothetical protein